MGIFRRGWCRPRGGVASLSFGWGRLPGSHGGRSRGRDPQTQQKTKEGEERATKILLGEKMKINLDIYSKKFALAMPQRRVYAAT